VPAPALVMRVIRCNGVDLREEAVSNTPTLREQREAHDRRARIIDGMQAQATARSNQVLTQHRMIEAKFGSLVLWRRTRFMLIGVVFIVLVLACLFALVAMLVMTS
jgi:hypothetical protein